MFAVIIEETGGAEVFQYAEVPTPEPAPGEVLIRVMYAGVNPADWKNRQGLLEQYRPYVFPYIIGFDAAGVVAAVGDGVSGIAVGDRVFSPTNHGQGGQGSYAEYTIADAERVAAMPDALGFREAAAIPVPGLTAWQGIYSGFEQAEGKLALIHGGSGSVGSFAVQFARRRGARVAATCSAHNIEYLKSLGVERVIDYQAENIAQSVAEWAPEGVDYLMDAVGVSTLPGAINLVRAGGTYVSIPTLVDDGDIEASFVEAQRRQINRQFSVMDDSNCAGTLNTIAGLVGTGEIQLPPILEFPLVDVSAVHEQLQHGAKRGKIVLKVAD